MTISRYLHNIYDYKQPGYNDPSTDEIKDKDTYSKRYIIHPDRNTQRIYETIQRNMEGRHFNTLYAYHLPYLRIDSFLPKLMVESSSCPPASIDENPPLPLVPRETIVTPSQSTSTCNWYYRSVHLIHLKPCSSIHYI